MVAVVVSQESPADPEVRGLLERHLAFARAVTPEGGVFALDPDAFEGPGVVLLGARVDGRLLGVGALQELDPDHAELKSMHTAAEARGQGIGRALVDHALGVARERGYRAVSLETGNFEEFAPARALYRSCGFRDCPPYGRYVGSPTSACMTIEIDQP